MCLVSLNTSPVPAPIVLPKILMDCPFEPMPSTMKASLTLPKISLETKLPTLKASNLIMTKNCNIYELGPLIREGKFGAIHSAAVLDRKTKLHELQVGQEVAVKVCSLSKMEQLRAFESPYTEIEVLKMIGNGNSHLVGLIESCIIGDSMYMIFPLYTEGDLLDVMESRFRGGMPSFLVKKLMMDIVQGVFSLHRQGIAHRDLSIENILFDQDNDNFAICDFGMAWYASCKNRPDALCGKGSYMAPELWNSSFDSSMSSFMRLAACDIWSCGVILFMALTGTAPFECAVSWDPLYQLIADGKFMELFDFDKLDQESIEIVHLINRIFHVDPHQRPTAHDLLSQLSQ